ncbi:hypothetical protein VitviT2T_023091 [Vitis vinifera]|uniref:Disease resistance protein At4g27190-like leucine-rich repeats domain-containing protein n=1 Tax=Vitis vinifera TaxID=29760 RepID=A0ABY9DD57_VITVI|nr:hypothetical protein VitviT2T_023091 [Vitis vinifera]
MVRLDLLRPCGQSCRSPATAATSSGCYRTAATAPLSIASSVVEAFSEEDTQVEKQVVMRIEGCTPSLESLFVGTLDNIRALRPSQLPANSFSKLRKLQVSGCNNLLNLFSLSVASALVQLEDLHILGSEAEAIVANENEDEAALRGLHHLKRFCSGRTDIELKGHYGDMARPIFKGVFFEVKRFDDTLLSWYFGCDSLEYGSNTT